jgi:hypothetical protein
MGHGGRTIGAALVAVALVLTGCGGDDDGEGAADAPTETTASNGTESTTTTEATTEATDDGGTDEPAVGLPDGYEGYTSEQYGGGRNWLCHPALTEEPTADENVCDRDLTATIVRPDLTTEVEPHEQAVEPAVDCFYVYPTISNDPGLNADLEPDDTQEIRALVNQVARLSSVCEVYAPVYRQLTIGSLLQRMGGSEVDQAAMDDAYQTAYGDVLDAWTHYVANDNDGRGVILVGHSQGAGMLRRLVREEIDTEPVLRDRLVAAYLLGTDFPVPVGEDVGGELTEIPLCRAADQVGCVVAYASFPASLPPDDTALFGTVDDDPATPDDESAGMESACVNPAALAGGSGTLIPYFTAEESSDALADLPAVDTPWVSLRDALTGECVDRDGHHVLEVTVNGDPTDIRDRNLSGGLPANWGLHLADVNLAMGNLEILAASQADAYGG